MSYENKTNEELIEILEDKDKEIEKLEYDKQEHDELSEEVSVLQMQVDELNSSIYAVESVLEKAFYSGRKSVVDANSTALKSWLTFKMENRM